MDSEQQSDETVQTETASEIPHQSVNSITENESDESKQNINENFENEILANTVFSL